jgi:hypothetical protein
LQEVLAKLTLGQGTIWSSVSVGKITDEFILQAYDTAVDLKHHMLQMCNHVPAMR